MPGKTLEAGRRASSARAAPGQEEGQVAGGHGLRWCLLGTSQTHLKGGKKVINKQKVFTSSWFVVFWCWAVVFTLWLVHQRGSEGVNPQGSREGSTSVTPLGYSTASLLQKQFRFHCLLTLF